MSKTQTKPARRPQGKAPENSGRAAGKPPAGRRFAPGQSGNPGGRPREIGYLRELAREKTEEAIETLADVMLNGDSDSARVAAATALLDRGYGRPSQSIEVEANVRDTRSSQIARAIADAHPELAELVFGAAVAGRLVAKKSGPEGDSGAGQAGADGS